MKNHLWLIKRILVVSSILGIFVAFVYFTDDTASRQENDQRLRAANANSAVLRIIEESDQEAQNTLEFNTCVRNGIQQGTQPTDSYKACLQAQIQADRRAYEEFKANGYK